MEKKLPPKLRLRARDHCHLTGRYRGPAHQDCNLQYQDSRTIAVVFHNLSNYDAHFIIKYIAVKITGRTTIIPQTMERYVSITKHITSMDVHFGFDSFRFWASSLDNLSSYLPATPITRQRFADISEEKLQLVTRKGVFFPNFSALAITKKEKKSSERPGLMSNHDPADPIHYLMYFDVINLYRWAMTQYLPYGGFEWADENLVALQL